MDHLVDTVVSLPKARAEQIYQFYRSMMETAPDQWHDDISDFWKKRLKKNFSFKFDLSSGTVGLSTKEAYAETLSRSHRLTRWINTHLRLRSLQKNLQCSENDDFLVNLLSLSLPHHSGVRFGSKIGQRLLSPTFLKYLDAVYLLFLTTKVYGVPWRENPVVLEIGAGIGMLGVIFKQLLPQAKFIVVDLPHSVMISAIYLSYLFPDSKFFLWGGEESISQEDFSESDFIFFPHYAISKLPPDSCDLIWNMASMGEMTQENVDQYFREIRRLIIRDGLFFNSNRYRKTTEFLNYPYHRNDRHLYKGFNRFAASIPKITWKRRSSGSRFHVPRWKPAHHGLFMNWISQMDKISSG